MITGKLLRGVGIASIMAAMAACQTADEGAPEAAPKDETSVQVHLRALPRASVVSVDDAQIPTLVKGNLGSIEVEDEPSKADLRDVLKAVAPVFGADPGSLVLERARNNEQLGMQHFRYGQVKNGRKVLGGGLMLHARDGIIVAANGSARDDASAPAEPKIQAADAIREARDSSAEVADVAVSDKVELAYFRSGDKLELVYSVEVTGTREDGTPVRDTVLVNAVDGSIVRRLPQIHEALSRSVHDAENGWQLPGVLARAEGAPAHADPVVNTNYDLLGTTYDCYASLFGRDSFDNNGAQLISTVHYDYQYVNAFWDGTQMVYGDGDGVLSNNLALSLDVTAHELTHAVTQHESDLYYSEESGGLNESMSDIFGNVCEWYRDGYVISGNTWKVGEEVWTPGTPDDALRYLNDPALDGASLDYYPDYYPGVDVHYSSGIPNLAFHLLAVGGSHPRGKTSTVVQPLGFDYAAAIFYYANAEVFGPNTTFAEAKVGTETVAEWFGFTPEQIAASVSAAWEAVGVDGSTPPPPPGDIELENNVPVYDLYGTYGSQQYFYMEVPEGQADVGFVTSGLGFGDVDLYVWSPDGVSCYSGTSSTGDEYCNFGNPQAGVYYGVVLGNNDFSGVALMGSYYPLAPQGHLVINEVDYDQPGAPDLGEFVEIYNASNVPADLSSLSLLLVNGGNNAIYSSVHLGQGGVLQPGQYLVVGAASVAVPADAVKINFSGSQENRIQNGAPDGLLIFDNATGEVIDAFSYEGSITAASIPGVGAVSLVEGEPLPATVVDSGKASRSLGRFLNGTDTDNAATDWAATPTPTPGSLNVL